MTGKSKYKQLADTEKAIGRRLALGRKAKLWHQHELAVEMGISRDQLASVEAGRVPLTTASALRIAEVMGVNLMWLAEGIGASHRRLAIPVSLVEAANKTKYFRASYESVLREFFWDDFKKTTERHAAGVYSGNEVSIEIPLRRRTSGGNKTLDGVTWNLVWAIQMMPPNLHEELLARVSKTISEFLVVHDQAIQTFGQKQLFGPKSLDAISQGQKNELTEPAISEKLLAVKHPLEPLTLKQLLVQLDRATRESGKMSELAKFLAKATKRKVPLASVSRWLSGKREPGGEITLLMRQWVEQQEG